MSRIKENSFSEERKNTDKSLDAERERTNRSILAANSTVELKTDEKVQNERRESDLKKFDARHKTDSLRDQSRLAKETENEKTIDTRTDQERQLIDEVVQNERAQFDKAIVQERETKVALETQLLNQERKQTDKNLEAERTRTDEVVQTTSVQLSAEFAEHSKTKHSLTTRDEFLAIVSHDLRNPMGTIASCVEMLLEEVDERNIDAETQTWLELIKRNANSSLRLINDILDMEQVAEGKLKMSIARHNVGEIIREAIDNYFHLATLKNILLHSQPETICLNMDCDKERLLQVLSNLIGNALKFTPEHGEIIIKSKKTTTSLTISVCDTGPGIPDAKKEKIFEKFAQLKSKERTGLGLGLHISKMLVEAHGGRLWVESKLDQGSNFCFELPLI